MTQNHRQNKKREKKKTADATVLVAVFALISHDPLGALKDFGQVQNCFSLTAPRQRPETDLGPVIGYFAQGSLILGRAPGGLWRQWLSLPARWVVFKLFA